MHIQPLHPAQLERQEIRLKQARLERESERQRLKKLVIELKKKQLQAEQASHEPA